MFFFYLYNKFASKLMTNLRLQDIPLEIDSMYEQIYILCSCSKKIEFNTSCFIQIPLFNVLHSKLMMGTWVLQYCLKVEMQQWRGFLQNINIIP